MKWKFRVFAYMPHEEFLSWLSVCKMAMIESLESWIEGTE